MDLSDSISMNLILTVFVLILTWSLLNHWRKNWNLPPGPWGIPFFGYYIFLSPKPYLDFKRLSEKYGNIISFRSAGGELFVVLNGIKLIKEILINRADEFIGRPVESNLLEWISDGLGVTQEEGPTWKEHRRYFLHTVKNYGFGKLALEGTIQEEIGIMINDLKKINGRSTDIFFHVTYVVNSIISQIMFARKFEKYGEIFPELAKAAHNLIDIFADHRFMLVGYPFQLAMYLLPWSGKIRQSRAYLKKTVKNIIDDHMRTFDPNHLRDYVDSYLHHREVLKSRGELEKSSFTLERLLAISMNMTMEGTESVGDSISRLLIEASKHPEEQRNAQKEIDAIVGRERLPSWVDRSKLPYLDAFIQELFRIAQAFLITTHYSNFEETSIDGYRIPKRSVVVGNLWTINQDPSLYPNPSAFDVQRFLDKDGKRIKTEGPYPFSMGKRDCVGQSLAQMEVFLIISSLLQSFTLQPGDRDAELQLIPRGN